MDSDAVKQKTSVEKYFLYVERSDKVKTIIFVQWKSVQR